MDKKLSGIQLIGSMDLVFGVGVFGYLVYGAISWVIEFGKASSAVNIIGLLLLVVLLLISVGLMKLGFLTLNLRPGAIVGNVLLAVLVSMEFLGSQLQLHSRFSQVVRWVLLSYSIWMLCYLSRRSVRELFKQPRTS